jgi:Ca2+-binding EF-hand superfamily protein
MFTCLQIIFVDGAFDIINQTDFHLGGIRYFFYGVIITGNTLLLNLITAVVLENALNMVQNDAENIAKQRRKADAKKKQQLEDIWNLITDGDTFTTVPQLEKFAAKESSQPILDQLQLSAGELTELFYIMDIDGSGELEKIEFVQGMMTMLKQVDAKDILSVTGRLNIVHDALIHHKEALDVQGKMVTELENSIAVAVEAVQRVNGVLPLRLADSVQDLTTSKNRKPAAVVNTGTRVTAAVEKEVQDAIVAIEPTPSNTLADYTKDGNGGGNGGIGGNDSVDPLSLSNVKWFLVMKALDSLGIKRELESGMEIGYAKFQELLVTLTLTADETQRIWSLLFPHSHKDDMVLLDVIQFAHNLSIEGFNIVYLDPAFVRLRYMLYHKAIKSTVDEKQFQATYDEEAFSEVLKLLKIDLRHARSAYHTVIGSESTTLSEFARCLAFDHSGFSPYLAPNIRSVLLSIAFKWHVCGSSSQAEGSKHVTVDGFKDQMYKLGMNQQEAQKMFMLLDQRHKRRLDQGGFTHELIMNSMDKNFTPLITMLLQYMFKMMEGERTGQPMSPDAFGVKLQRLGFSMADSRRLFAAVDKNHDGTLSVDEFLAHLAGQEHSQSWHIKYTILNAAFEDITADKKSHAMSPADLANAMRAYGVIETDVMRLFEAMDNDGDGTLTAPEFCRALTAERNPLFVKIKWAIMKACFQTLGGTPLKRAQFIQALANYGALPEDAEHMFSRMDRNKDGTVDAMEFCHAMSVDGTAAADPRVFLMVKYLVCKAVFLHFSKQPAQWSRDMQVEALASALHVIGVQRDSTRNAYISICGRGSTDTVSPAHFIHTCLSISSTDTCFAKVRGPMFHALPKVLQVTPHSQLSTELFVTLMSRVNIDAERAQAVFSMIDVEHRGVLQWEFFLATLDS